VLASQGDWRHLLIGYVGLLRLELGSDMMLPCLARWVKLGEKRCQDLGEELLCEEEVKRRKI